MQIREMNATFGKLKNAQLSLQPGLNCIYAPNESGKSTWSHFLRVMLYGISTRERGAMADKNRFAPWEGWAMSGTMEVLTDEGESVTLRRNTARANAPMGDFSCTYTDTATAVAGISGENAGETLLGVGQEVFLRSAFIRHSALAVDKDAELERRIAALISTGEEELSFSEVHTRLKKQLNRRRHNKSGLLPALETEVAALQTQLHRLEDLQQQSCDARQMLRRYEDERQHLEQQEALWKRKALQEAWRTYNEAETAAQQTKLRTELLKEAYPNVPDGATLSMLEGRMAALQTTQSRAGQSQESVVKARRDVDSARSRWEKHPLYPDTAAQLDERMAALVAPKMPHRLWWLVPILSALGCGAAVCFYLPTPITALFAAAIGAGVLALGSVIALLWRSYTVRAKQTEAEKKKQALQQQIDTYLPLVAAYESAAESFSYSELRAQQDQQQLLGELNALLAALHPYTDASDAGGALTALRILRQQKEALDEAEKALTAAKLHRDVLAQHLPEGAQAAAEEEEALPTAAQDVLTQQLRHTMALEQSARSRLDTLTGQLRSLDEEDALRFRLRETLRQKDGLQEEYDAVALAMSVLDEANTTLQNRFSPALGARSADIFRRLTAGRYEKVLLSRDFSLETEEESGGAARSVMLLSQGAADQLYLAVRLAICDMVLPEGKSAPLILDDALLSFDDERLHAALDFLLEESRHRQILLFTCQKREQEYLAGRENVALLTL